jgi:CRISPR-associated protein Cas2
MFVNICYDIENDKTRTRLAHKLKDFGPRVQKSVFEADVSKEEFIKLNKMLAAVKLDKNDSIRIYVLCQECLKKIKILGKGEITKDKDYYIA